MAGQTFIGAVDQGTTGTRFMLFDRDGAPRVRAYREHEQIYPRPGWIEHDARQIWRNVQLVMAQALTSARVEPGQVAAIGVTNQRETALAWDPGTGEPLHNAIVWQDRRTAARCRELREAGLERRLRALTGLPVDPYFSATKFEWLLANVPGLRERAADGHALLGTVDAWLLWKLTGRHVTDVTNASRTLLMDLEGRDWHPELLDLFGLPRAALPEIRPNAEVYGQFSTAAIDAAGLQVPGAAAEIPVAGSMGDQQAALFGQAGFGSGDTKNTYGTGSFLLCNTGTRRVDSGHGLITTVAYELPDLPTHYALEGSVFVTGAAVQWLRDGLGLVRTSGETESLAESVPDAGGVYFVPAFAGLGAPYWNSEARGTIVGLTRGTTAAHIVRAALESMAYQTYDVLEAMEADLDAAGMGTPGARPRLAEDGLKVDGGAVRNDLLCQMQADLLGVPVLRSAVAETTALGAAYAAGLAVGFWSSPEEVRAQWQPDRVFQSQLPAAERGRMRAGWRRAVRAALAAADTAD